MKRFNIWTQSCLLMTGLLWSLASFAQTLPTSGTWNATTVSTQTVNLTGDISLKGTITIPNGVTLTINANGANRSIYNNSATTVSLTNMFLIQKGGTLNIQGTSSYQITVGGGANFTQPTGDYIESINALTNPVRTMKGPAIYNRSGRLLLEYVTIQNVYNATEINGPDASGAVCHQSSDNETPAYTTIKHCLFKNCKSFLGVGVFLAPKSQGKAIIEDTEFHHCLTTTTSTEFHGAVVRGWGNVGTHLDLTRVKIHHCFSNSDSGAIYWPANAVNSDDGKYATLTMNGCEIYNNNAIANGGGMDICANLTLTGATTKVHHNKCGTFGGGMSVRAYTSGSPAPNPVEVTYDLSEKLEVYENQSTGNGGGMAVIFQNNTTLQEGSSFYIELNGCKIRDNQSPFYGGGVYLENQIEKTGYEVYLNMDSGEVYYNKAGVDGGGIYAKRCVINSNEENDKFIKIHNNETVRNGAGIYAIDVVYIMNGGQIYKNKSTSDENGLGGGVYIGGKNASLKIYGGDIYENESLYGGGLAIAPGVSTDSSFEKVLFEGGKIYKNKARSNGGGVTITNENADICGTIRFNGGEFYENESGANGGGLFVNNHATVLFSDGSFHDNKAQNGGGIALANGAFLKFSKGYVSKNMAVSTTPIQTGYHQTSQNSGLGGGIYLQNTSGNTTYPTTFKITLDDFYNVQIYGNTASNGADDIFSNGLNTSFTAPNPEGITLSSGLVSQGWFEDYVTGDTGYGNGTNIMGSAATAASIIRYNTSVSQNSDTYDASNLLTGDYKKYACLTLGYKLIDITVTKSGLKSGESATFDLLDGDNVRRYQLILTGVEGQDKVSQVVNIQPSNTTLTVKETTWGWSYKPAEGTVTQITKDVSNADNRLFEFKNVKDTKLIHSESIKENVFTYDGSAPIIPDVQCDPMDEGWQHELDFDL